MDDQKKKKKRLSGRTKVWIARGCLLAILLSIGLPVYAWFAHQRSLATVVKVNSPVKLSIKAGKAEDIILFKMAGIDATASSHYKDFVFCVEGSGVDDYNLQIAHTTNIQFEYTLYKAHSKADGEVEYTSEDGSKVYYTKAMEFTSDKGDYINLSTQANSGRQIGNDSYELASYDSGENRQSYAEPLYWQTKVAIDPDDVDSEAANASYNESDRADLFLNYYVLRISWDPVKVTNDKETDLVYITAQVN